MKNITTLVLFSIILLFGSCKKDETIVPVSKEKPAEKWHVEITFERTSISLDSKKIYNMVGNYDPKTGQNPIIGHEVYFEAQDGTFEFSFEYDLKSEVINPFTYGKYNGQFFVLHMDTNLIGFCHGKSDVPVSVVLTRLE